MPAKREAAQVHGRRAGAQREGKKKSTGMRRERAGEDGQQARAQEEELTPWDREAARGARTNIKRASSRRSRTDDRAPAEVTGPRSANRAQGAEPRLTDASDEVRRRSFTAHDGGQAMPNPARSRARSRRALALTGATVLIAGPRGHRPGGAGHQWRRLQRAVRADITPSDFTDAAATQRDSTTRTSRSRRHDFSTTRQGPHALRDVMTVTPATGRSWGCPRGWSAIRPTRTGS